MDKSSLKVVLSKLLAKTAAVAAVAIILFGQLGSPASAAVSSWQKGASIVPQNSTDFSSASFEQSLRNLASTNANFVTLVIPYYQSNTWSSDLHAGWNTPTDQSLLNGIQTAHGLGLKVNLKPHLESYDNGWRANINASDRNAWFTAYDAMLQRYGKLAQSNGVEQMTVGAELINMASTWSDSSNTQRWANMINNLRKVYSGTLTYSANWGCCGWSDEKNNIGFWSELDVVGISAYYELGWDYHNNSPDSLIQHWDNVNRNDITPFQQRVGKPVVFTEVGFKSVTGAHTRPWDYNLGGPADQTEQANNYEAMFSYWDSQPFMQGVQLWDWKSNPNAGGSGDTDYTPQNKQAQEVMTKWFASSGTGTPPPTTGGGIITPDLSSSASASPNPVTTGGQTTVTAQVANSGQTLSNAIVDVEIYGSGGQQVLQRVFENQTIAAGESSAYNFSWTPPSAGTYTVKIGVFNSSWSRLYDWQDSAGTITVSSQTTGGPIITPPPGNNTPPPVPVIVGQIDLWWPTDGSTLSGSQPFKALLTNAELSGYTMYWQVDNGTLNQMYDSQQDWPHKEAWVDLSSWAWNNNGPYTLNFVAKDSQGNTIAQRQVTIYIAR